jgi:hypothetical protein
MRKLLMWLVDKLPKAEGDDEVLLYNNAAACAAALCCGVLCCLLMWAVDELPETVDKCF